MSLFERKAWAILAVALCSLLPGCGTPGAPQPPSLNLAEPVKDLAAIRTGKQVTLSWTMPKRNTDRTTIKGDMISRICRRDSAGKCNPIGPDKELPPGKPGSFVDMLPASVASGAPRPVSYFVELLNRRNRSAGLSNAATILAGEAPNSVDGLRAEVRKQGVVLNWTPDGENAAIRLRRKLLTPPAKNAHAGLLAPAPEPLEQNLIVESAAEESRTIDNTVRIGETYEYRAQRVSRVEVDGKMLELAGEFSPPVDVDVKDVFPPPVPADVAAVATAGENGMAPAIDLSWQPDTDPDLAGYIVYRREGEGEWLRISSAQPVIEPAYHDAQVQPGHTYHYAVSAVSKAGHESERSQEEQEAVPQP